MVSHKESSYSLSYPPINAVDLNYFSIERYQILTLPTFEMEKKEYLLFLLLI